MAVSKRTRYEVFRRDNHTCRYCGATPGDTELTVDHVTPVALGGTDYPDNLVTACKDCNAGKASVPPGADLVADVRQSDLKWAAAMARVAETRATEQEKVQAYVDSFNDRWMDWYYGWQKKTPFPKPPNWRQTIERFYSLGIPIHELWRCTEVALSNHNVDLDDRFRYFAGCVWRVVTEMQEAAKLILEADAMDDRDGSEGS